MKREVKPNPPPALQIPAASWAALRVDTEARDHQSTMAQIDSVR